MTGSEADTDVVVVGAGPTGLTLACGLRLHGLSVHVIDRAAAPATTSRANFLHARGSEVLARLGALGDLPEQSLRAMRVTTYAGDRPMMKLSFGDPGMGTAAPPMVVSQAKVEAALRDRLADLGVAPQWGNGLARLRQDADSVEAELADGQRIRAQWLVGCDGTSSTTRKLVGIGFPGVKLSERFLLADVHLQWNLDRGGTSGWVHPDGLVGVMPMPDDSGRDDLWRVFAYDPAGREKPSDAEILDRITAILPQRTGRAVRVGEPEWLSVFTVHRRLAARYRSGRVFLAGDAAHAHAPFGGQGMLTGVGDAENLAFKLALAVRGQAGDALLDTYEAERRPLATEVLRGTSAMTRLNVASTAVGRFLRDQVMIRIAGLSLVQRWATYSASQLWVSYRKGPLGGRGRKPRPGDRIADQACTRDDGTPTRLHAELGGRWALLEPASGGGAGLQAARRWLGEFVVGLDHDGDEVMLVRPDAHLAWRGSDVAVLQRWLRDALAAGMTR